MDVLYQAIIVGAGPAGLTAGLYTSRAGLRTLIIEKETPGGELMDRDLIENYPGYPGGIPGAELGSRMLEQVTDCGAEIRLGEVNGIEIKGGLKVVSTSQGDYRGEAMIIAGGANPKKLGVPGELEYSGRGVFYCATCDGPHFMNKVVAVAGGGDSGITEALFLTRLVSRVVVIESAAGLTATRVLQARAFANPRIEVRCGARIEAIRGDDRVRVVELRDMLTGQKQDLEVDGVLVHVGVEANTGYLTGGLPLNERGQIMVNEEMKTGIAGVLAAGDVRHNSPMQIAAAVGDGATAALSLGKYLGSH